MKNITKEVGLNIRKIREDKGLSQEKLAALADLDVEFRQVIVPGC